MTKLFIDYDQYCIYSRYDEGKYASWEESYHFSVNNAFLANEYEGCEAFETIQDVTVGDTIYVVVIRYSDGNSFGKSEGKGEILWVFTSEEVAEKASNTFTKAIDEDNKPYTIEIELEDSSKVKIGNPVYDYFTVLEKCEVIELKVKEFKNV